MATCMNIEDLWFSLSFFFIDNEIDYEDIAKEISEYDIETIEFQMFYNVAPICSPNLEQIIPPIWIGFNKEELIKDIKEHGVCDESQMTLKRKIAAKLYRFKYRKEWDMVKSFLK